MCSNPSNGLKTGFSWFWFAIARFTNGTNLVPDKLCLPAAAGSANRQLLISQAWSDILLRRFINMPVLCQLHFVSRIKKVANPDPKYFERFKCRVGNFATPFCTYQNTLYIPFASPQFSNLLIFQSSNWVSELPALCQ
jgi:hypothetical protein